MRSKGRAALGWRGGACGPSALGRSEVGVQRSGAGSTVAAGREGGEGTEMYRRVSSCGAGATALSVCMQRGVRYMCSKAATELMRRVRVSWSE